MRQEKEATTRIAVENWNRQKRDTARKKKMGGLRFRDKIKSNDKKFPPLIDFVND